MATQALATRVNGQASHNGRNGTNRLSIQQLLALLGGFSLEDDHYFEGGHLPLPTINVFPQTRKTFEDIPTFAQGIARNRLLHPIIIAVFDRKGCEQYLALLSHIWRTKLTMQGVIGMVEGEQEIFYVLLAGERRFRSHQHLWEFGCMSCQDKFGSETKGSCFRRHLKMDKVEVRFARDITPVGALVLQLNENTHLPVPPHEEAYVYAELFRLCRAVDPACPLAPFARSLGRSPETVRNAIRYCDLTSVIQKAVEKGQIPYGIALEIARIKAVQDIKPEELEWWMLRAITGNQKVPIFREVITQYLSNLQNGQGSLLDIMTEKGRRLLEKRTFRKTVEAQTIQAMWSWIYYFGKVFQLFDEGLLGKADSPFSTRSPVKVFRRLLDNLERVLPHMRGLIPAQEWKKRRQMLQRAQQVAAILKEYIPETQEKGTSLVTVG